MPVSTQEYVFLTVFPFAAAVFHFLVLQTF
jgi:hypothetical protein